MTFGTAPLPESKRVLPSVLFAARQQAAEPLFPLRSRPCLRPSLPKQGPAQQDDSALFVPFKLTATQSQKSSRSRRRRRLQLFSWLLFSTSIDFLSPSSSNFTSISHLFDVVSAHFGGTLRRQRLVASPSPRSTSSSPRQTQSNSIATLCAPNHTFALRSTRSLRH